ncbi:hypothetical protein TNCV_2505361 [Trichonephila clavipes]|uniref:Uncharacterized protein n=1 Tax=Trichonephila clavipes TaxID=2585209 RepID=A0A8X7BK70_TRICX|nr:hypothetical protein TNCV_2505361 [Trichonephila clavipes]
MWFGMILLKKRPGYYKRKQNSSQNVFDVPLCCKCASNDDQRGPAVKRSGTPDHNSWLMVYVACNSEKQDRHAALAVSRHVFDDRQDTDGSRIRR